MRILLLLGLLLLACICYLFGSVTGTLLFIFIGMGFELAFWIGLFKPKQAKH